MPEQESTRECTSGDGAPVSHAILAPVRLYSNQFEVMQVTYLNSIKLRISDVGKGV